MAFRYAVIVGALFTVAFAQQPSKPSGQTGSSTVLKSTTRLVVIDVVASNSRGEPVLDLRAQDFKVLENGKPQDIRVFEFQDRKSTRLNSSHSSISYAVFCLKKKNKNNN